MRTNRVDPSVGEQVRRLRALQDEKDRLKYRDSQINEEATTIKRQLLDYFDSQEGVESIKVEGAGTARLMSQLYAKVTDKAAATAALREMGREELITEEISKSRLNAYVKECAMQGDPLPDGIEATEVTDIDGKVATRDGDSQWISCEASREQAHHWRAEVDAVQPARFTRV